MTAILANDVHGHIVVATWSEVRFAHSLIIKQDPDLTQNVVPRSFNLPVTQSQLLSEYCLALLLSMSFPNKHSWSRQSSPYVCVYNTA